MNHLVTMSSKLSVLIALFAALNLSGCASNCSTNPGEMTRLCGASYQLGMNKKLEQHLEDRQAQVDEMKLQSEDMRARLTESDELVAKAQLKLQAVEAKTSGAREDARRIRGELALKRMDIETKQEELVELERRLTELRAEKSDKQETTVALAQTRNEIMQTKTEVDQLNQYLAEDLLIRAENALAYE